MGRRAIILTYPGGEMHPTSLPEPLGPLLALKNGQRKDAPLGPLLGAALKGMLHWLVIGDENCFNV